MNPLVITLSVILATVIAWTAWKLHTASGESRPLWLDLLITGMILTILWGGARLAKAFTEGAAGGMAQLIGMGIFMLGFLALLTLWRELIFGFISRPITDSFTGGTERVEPKPFYSAALAHRRHHHHQAALDAIDAELARFPLDAEGWLLKAEIQAKDMQDPESALLTLRSFSSKAPREALPEVLLREADLLLFTLRQPDPARVVLHRIIAEHGDTGAGEIARQRLAYFPSDASWLDGSPLGEREVLTVVQHEEKLGLTDDLGASRIAATTDPEEERIQLVCELVEFPDDVVRRERLARLHAGPLNRPDLAHEELERLVRTPGVRDRDVFRWLNLAADIHLQSPDGIPAARLVLERIIERFPGSAGAALASQRLSTLARSAAGTRTETTIRLGNYGNNVGLQTERRFSATRANLPGLYQDPEVAPDPDASPEVMPRIPTITATGSAGATDAPDVRG